MGPNTMNFCTSQGLYGVYVDGRSLASIFAVVLVVYTIIVGFLGFSFYWLRGRYYASKFQRGGKPAGSPRSLRANFLEASEEDADYSHEAMLGL